MRIAFVAPRFPSRHRGAVTAEVVRLLRDWGAEVDIIDPDESAFELARITPEHDLYVLQSRTEMAMSVGGALHAAGATLLNPYPVAALLRDRITTTRVLQAARVPTPDTFVTSHPEQLAQLVREGPIVIKPYRGAGTHGVHVVWDVDELDDVPATQGPIVAQRLIERSGAVRRLYCVAGQVFGVLRTWPQRRYADKVGEAFTVSTALRALALRVGEALGIDVYGLDVIGPEATPYVVDVQSFPSLKGVPEGALRLADYVYHCAHEASAGRLAGGDQLAALGRIA